MNMNEVDYIDEKIGSVLQNISTESKELLDFLNNEGAYPDIVKDVEELNFKANSIIKELIKAKVLEQVD